MAEASVPSINERTPLIPDTAKATDAGTNVRETYKSSHVDEEASTISPGEYAPKDDAPSLDLIYAVLPTLLLGVFIAQADSSIVLATSQEIASEFSSLSGASWLITTYTLAQCACQPLYGKLSDIFGRKPALAFAYAVFAAGCVLCGISVEYWQVLAGRAISGIGGAGMVGLVAVIIADMLPPRQVAAWRSYVNVVATLGRTCGGPTGGWLVDNVGWRWCFLGQCPVAALAVVLLLWRLPTKIGRVQEHQDLSVREKIARIDFAGFLIIPVALTTAFIALDFAGKMYHWVYIAPMAIAAVGLFVLFYYVEEYYAAEPIIPISLISKPDVLVPYFLTIVQTAAQFILTYTIPTYFQIAGEMSVTAAGSRIVFIVLGNTLGGLVTGWLVSRTGLYKTLTLVATILGNICYILVLVRWHGTSSWADTWYVTLGGIGMGSTQNTTFVHLTAALEPKDMAIAGTTWFLSQGIGMLVAANFFNMIHNITLVNVLHQTLKDVTDKEKIIQGALSDIEYIQSLPSHLKTIVSRAFVKSLVPTNALTLACGISATLITLLIRERPLDRK